MLDDLERQVENAVADIIDDPGEAASTGNGKEPKPVLSPVQQAIANSLNKLPLEKRFAFLDVGHNAHATIVARDVKRFEVHKRGWGIIRHWADSFTL